MNRLAEKHEFRWVEKSKRFLGIHRGILVEVSEWEGKVTFKFSSPTASLGDEAVEHFAGFTRCNEGGLPTNWISFTVVGDERGNERVSDQGCIVSVDKSRIDGIGVETFERIPDLVAEDLHAHGASDTLPCAHCENNDASTVGLLNYGYVPMCEYCWRDLHLHTSRGKLATEQSVNWLLVVPVVAILTVVGGWAWGFIQQPHVAGSLDVRFLLLPAAWAFGICWAAAYLSGGVTRTLRLSLFLSVILSVLIGNIWGFRSFVMQQIVEQGNQQIVGPNWMESMKLYFSALPNSWQGEAPFLLAGLVGAWVGLRLLKSQETIDVQ